MGYISARLDYNGSGIYMCVSLNLLRSVFYANDWIWGTGCNLGRRSEKARFFSSDLRSPRHAIKHQSAKRASDRRHTSTLVTTVLICSFLFANMLKFNSITAVYLTSRPIILFPASSIHDLGEKHELIIQPPP